MLGTRGDCGKRAWLMHLLSHPTQRLREKKNHSNSVNGYFHGRKGAIHLLPILLLLLTNITCTGVGFEYCSILRRFF